MKTLIAIFVLGLGSVSFAINIKASLSGSATESQILQSADGGHTLKDVGYATLKEESRSQNATELTIDFLPTSSDATDYCSILNEGQAFYLTLDLSSLAPYGEATRIDAKVQTLIGEDDQVGRAEGFCVLRLDQSLSCHMTPTSNPFGLIDNTQLNINLN
jgi:hypothetical protein